MVTSSLGRTLTSVAAAAVATGALSAVPAAATDAPTARAATGSFTVALDTDTLRLEPRGANCLLTVDGQATFTGTVEGTATATANALVLASCDVVATEPPGSSPDVFRSVGTFTGTVDGVPVTDVRLVYSGVTRAGGVIEQATITLQGPATGALRVSDARVGIGGDYDGVVHVR